MPISRYEIRNEYSLADPELYRSADKDDPEALLEGVAMAGLVGVLRQLGDLAEFAAQIFNDLHEDVMATAARGHGLTIRVQQLESDVPFIEKAFLSQTDHSPFFYNAGFDWHSNLRMDQNLVTKGELPRFVMDSYEECRGPPRLFLLDKFDVAGAGACLKRYTDPSFFKVETSRVSRSDVQREKILKVKKKGPRWRKGETPEVLSTTQAKLHQLFMEERDGNGVGNPARRVKLKRRLNGFPFDSVTGSGYMERFLKTLSPEHKVLHEVTVSSSPLMLPTNIESKVSEVRTVNPDTESVGRKRTLPSPGREEVLPNLSVYETSKEDKICEVPSSCPSMATDEISSTFDKLIGEKDIALKEEGKTEAGLNSYESDEIASEVDNYVDAPSTIESEMDTDSELRVKRDFTSKIIKAQSLISDANEEDNHTRSSDSQSTRESIISDEGSSSSKKEMSSFSSSGSPSTSAENPHSEKNWDEGFPSADVPEVDIVDARPYLRTSDVELRMDQHPKSLASDNTCTSTDAMTNHRSGFDQLPSSLGNAEAQPTLVTDPPCSPIISDFASESVDGSQISPGEEQVEPNGVNVPFTYTVINNLCHTDSSIAISADFLHEDDCNCEDLNLVVGGASTLNMCNILSPNRNDNPEMIPSENTILYNMDDEVSNSPDNISSDCLALRRDNIVSTVSEAEKLPEDLVLKESNCSTDSSNGFSYIMETSHGEEPFEASLASAHSVEAEEDYSNRSISNQITSENLILPHVVNSLDWPGTVLDSHGRDVVPEEETIANETPAQSCEVVSLQGPEVADEFNPKDSATLESLCGSPENLEGPASDSIENSIGLEVTEIVGPTDVKLLNEVHEPLNESDTDQLETVDIDSAAPAISDNANRNDVHLPVSPDEWVAEHTPCSEDAGMGELGDDENFLSGSPRKSSFMGEVSQSEAIISDLYGVLCNTIIDNHLHSEVSKIVPDSNLHSDADHSLELFDFTAVQPAMEQSGFDAEQETLQKSSFINHGSDDPSLPIIFNTKEIIFQEKMELPPNQLDEELLDSGEINSGLSPLFPTNRNKVLYHDDDKEDNNSGLMFSLFKAASPPFSSELPGLSNEKSDFSGRTKDLMGSILPPSNHFSETNQVNLDELPPLPPLPPVQWRMGKLQHASSISEGVIMKQELFPRIIPPPTASTDAVSPSLEDTNLSLVQMPPETSSKEEKVEHSLSNLEASAMYETADFQQEIENESPQTSTSVDDGSTLEKMKHSLIQVDQETVLKEKEHFSSSLEACAVIETIVLPPKVENELQQPTASNTDVSSLLEKMNYPETASKREKVQHSFSNLEANPVPETVDLPPQIENEHPKFVKSLSGSELTPPAEEDGVPNGSFTMKLPRPRNPLIDAVFAIDKSKLRKVTERVRPEIQKVDERDSLLEQIRTKSFNLKPAVASRPSIRGPNTNLKVSAMMEKANAIRQALTDSDEDDEDDWSDS